jgi:hypothetical protein
MSSWDFRNHSAAKSLEVSGCELVLDVECVRLGDGLVVVVGDDIGTVCFRRPECKSYVGLELVILGRSLEQGVGRRKSLVRFSELIE